jgi:hypothetical protein
MALLRTLLPLVALLLCAGNGKPAMAAAGPQPGNYALIFGTVWGADHRPVYGVHVKLRRADEKKFRWEATSDHRGEFGIRVPAAKGDYVLVPDVKFADHRPAPEQAIHVDYDERVDVGVHLEP